MVENENEEDEDDEDDEVEDDEDEEVEDENEEEVEEEEEEVEVVTSELFGLFLVDTDYIYSVDFASISHRVRSLLGSGSSSLAQADLTGVHLSFWWGLSMNQRQNQVFGPPPFLPILFSSILLPLFLGKCLSPIQPPSVPAGNSALDCA